MTVRSPPRDRLAVAEPRAGDAVEQAAQAADARALAAAFVGIGLSPRTGRSRACARRTRDRTRCRGCRRTRCRRDAAVGVAVGGVVDEAAGLADPFAASTWQRYAIDDRGRPPGVPARSSTPATATTPRLAATVILLRGGADDARAAARQAQPRARGSWAASWVFPGGAVDTRRGRGRRAHRAAALRELEEEAGVTLDDPAALVPFSRWITPAEVKIRFDTWFFLAPRARRRRAADRRRGGGRHRAGSRRRARSTPTSAARSCSSSRRSRRSSSSRRSRPPTRCSTTRAARTVEPGRRRRSSWAARPRASCCPASRATT